MNFAIFLGTIVFQILPGKVQTNFARYNNKMAPKSPYAICAKPIVSSEDDVTVDILCLTLFN